MSEQEMKQDIMALAEMIASIAETEVELGTPTEDTESALEQAIEIVERVFGADADDLDGLRESKRVITDSLADLR